MSDKMKNLVVRTLSGIVLCAVVLGAILWTQWSFGALFALLLVAGMGEFYALAEKRGQSPQQIVGVVAGLLLFAANFLLATRLLDGQVTFLFALLSLIPFLMFICELFRKHETPMANIAITLAGVVYVALPLSMLCYIPLFGAEAWNPWIILFLIFIIWANDVFAYLVGMSIGRHRLCERLSPKKSWEGFFGGLAGAVLMGWIASRVMHGDAELWIGLALIASVAGVLGDLVESMFKRSAGVKDSGNLIPGHGGVLDRFDALLLAAPFACVYLFCVM